jgi:hypothetical protein
MYPHTDISLEHNIRMDVMCSCELNSSGSEQEPVTGSCEHSNERSGSIKGG